MASLSRPASLVAVSCLVACNALWGLDELVYSASAGGGGSSSTGTAGSPTSGGGGSGGSTTTCEEDDDCVDGDPCTVGTCDDGGCSQVTLEAGSPGTSEAACEGTCQTDGACGLSLYRRNLNADRMFEREPLSVAWTGDGAPPPRGIAAAAHAYQENLLVVFTDEGMVHLRSGNDWTAAPTGALFDGLQGVVPNSATMYQGQANGPQALLVTAGGDGNEQLAFVFELQGGNVTADPANPFVIEPAQDPMAAAQRSTDADWELSVQTAFLGTPSWVVFWRSYEGDVYAVDGGDFTWTAHGPDVQSPLWADGGPSAGTTRAAYHAGSRIYLVAP